MERKFENFKRIIVTILVIAIVIACALLIKAAFTEKKTNPSEVDDPKPTTIPTVTPTPSKEIDVTMTNDYNTDIIKLFHASANKTNYLLSPYNIEIALNMLRDGADGNTKTELDKVLGNRTINNIIVKNKISVANAIFIKNKFKNDVIDSYYNILKTKYNSDLIYDDFVTPNKINNWVNDKTSGMIKKVLDNISPDFVMGLASALAIDVKWQSEFDCSLTNKQDFTKIDNKIIDAEMMHESYKYGAQYIKTEDATGIIIPYRKEWEENTELEFVGILPNKDVDTYINGLTKDKLNNLFKNTKSASSSYHINLSLPRFTYDYSEEEFKEILIKMGIKDAFTSSANFKKMINQDVYVGTAIHKTHIDLNEKGTKAAAITFFGLDGAMAIEEKYETVNVIFNKPFVYMIRERNTGEILFFGTVYEPNIWNGNTCSEES